MNRGDMSLKCIVMLNYVLILLKVGATLNIPVKPSDFYPKKEPVEEARTARSEQDIKAILKE